MRVFKKDVGRWVKVHWDSPGDLVGLLIEAEPESRYVRVWSPTTGQIYTIEPSQVTKQYDYVKVPKL